MPAREQSSDLHWGDQGVAESNWRATRLSTLLVAVVTAGVGWLLASHIRALQTVGIGLVGIVLLALSFWLYGFDQWQILARFAANLLAPVGAVMMFAAVGLLTAREFTTRFPQPSPSQLPQPALEVLSYVLVLVAILLAALGVIATVRPILNRRIAKSAFTEQIQTVILLAIAAVVAEFLYFRSNPPAQASAEIQELLDWRFGEFLGDIFLVPDPEPNLFPVLFLILVSLVSLRLAINVLPLAELHNHLEVETEREIWFPFSMEVVVNLLMFLTGIIGFLGLLLSLGLSSDLEVLRESYPGVIDFLRPIAANPGLRQLLAGITVVSLSVYLVIWLVKKLVRAETTGMARRFTGFATAALFTLVLLFLQPTREMFGLIDIGVSNVPAGTRPEIRELLFEVVDLFGPLPLALFGLTGVVSLALLLTILIWITLGLQYLPEQQAGPSLASGGLFLALGFATTIGLSLEIAVVGLVGAMVVWDAGEFGQSLGSEIGQAGYQSRIELVHVVGTIAVGAVAAVVAITIDAMVRGFTVTNLSIVPLVLIGGITSILFLIVALR